MPNQLSEKQIQEIIQHLHNTTQIRSTKNYPWVTEDGAYDSTDQRSRFFIYNGFGYYIISKSWVEDPVQNQRLEEWMRAPWGVYPDLPPKPPKK